jgi:hypothetical protein
VPNFEQMEEIEHYNLMRMFERLERKHREARRRIVLALRHRGTAGMA